MAVGRGIVISPPFEAIEGGGIKFGGSPSAFDLRKYLLYWDMIDYADNNLISVGASDDIQYLLDIGVAKRTQAKFQGSVLLNMDFVIAAQESVYKNHEKESPGCWSLAQLSDKPFFTSSQKVIGLEFELFNMLPVPLADVPLPDILEFKERRKDELISLRCHMDDIYQSIITAADIPRARNSQIDKLEHSLKDLDKVLDEAGIKRAITSLRSYLSAEFLSALGVAVGIDSLFPSAPLRNGLVGAGVALAIKPIIAPKAKCIAKSFTYLNSIRRELT